MRKDYGKIVAAAILWKDGVVYSLPAPARHADIVHMMVTEKGIKPPINREQGFLTESGDFVRRKPAARLARLAGQVKKEDQMNAHVGLFSEDVW